MLVLTRRVGETITIGEEITVTVLGVKGNQVRIGVNAPKTIPVHREEIYERIRREERDNVNSNSGLTIGVVPYSQEAERAILHEGATNEALPARAAAAPRKRRSGVDGAAFNRR